MGSINDHKIDYNGEGEDFPSSMVYTQQNLT